MSLVKLLNLILLVSDQVKLFLHKLKIKQIIEAKDKSLESGDQRAFENAISDVDPNLVDDLPVSKYNGMHERPVKKKT